MFEQLDWKSWFTGGLIIVMIIALIRSFLRPHHIFLAALSALLIAGIISPMEALAGFTNNAVLTVGALFIVAAGVQQTRLFILLEKMLLPKKRGIGRTLFRIMSSTSVMSSFLNNTPIVAMFTPQMQKWADKLGIPVSKLLIPLSYAAIVGGTITLIGTSTNLIVSEMLSSRGYGSFHLFQLAWIGIPATILVIAWFALIGHRFLPDRKDPRVPETLPDAKLQKSKQADAGQANSGKNVLITEEMENPASGAVPGYRAQEHGTTLTGYKKPLVDKRLFRGNFVFASLLGGNNRSNGVNGTGNSVMHMSGNEPSETRDSTTRDSSGVLKNGQAGANLNGLSESDQQDFIPGKKRSKRVILILTLMIGFSATGVLPIHISVILAAVATIVTGVLPINKITKSINFSILLVIASALGLGAALENTGLAEVIAFSVMDTTSGFGIIVVLIGLYLLTNLLTELVTNNAAAVLMIPIALSTALTLGIDPHAVGITVAVAASASFLSPIGYQTNLMVMDPGGYKFTDYFKAGLPVTLILMTVTVSMVTWLWI